jgi:hypothetical protein
MGQRFGDLRARQTAFDSTAQVKIELVLVAHRGEHGDGDEAAIPQWQIGPSPQVASSPRS